VRGAVRPRHVGSRAHLDEPRSGAFELPRLEALRGAIKRVGPPSAEAMSRTLGPVDRFDEDDEGAVSRVSKVISGTRSR